MDYISALLVFLWSIIGGTTTFHDAAPPAGNPYSSIALTYCYENGRSEVYVRPGLPSIVYVHEFVHALDCADNGLLDSSLFPVPNLTGPIACDGCNSQVERQAVWVHQNPVDSYPALLAWARLRKAVWGETGGLKAGAIP